MSDIKEQLNVLANKCNELGNQLKLLAVSLNHATGDLMALSVEVQVLSRTQKIYEAQDEIIIGTIVNTIHCHACSDIAFIIEENRWYPATMEDLKDDFPWLSTYQITEALEHLIKIGIVIADPFDTADPDFGKWYRINLDCEESKKYFHKERKHDVEDDQDWSIDKLPPTRVF